MSLDASIWAWKQCPGSASTKLVLLSLADRAGEDHACYPSIERLTKDTHLNRKTVFSCLKKLQELGLIEDTGDRRGQTGQVKAYRLVGVVGRHDGAEDKSGKSVPKKEQSQKRNSTKKGTVPKQDENNPKIGSEKGTNSGTQNQSLEPIRESEETSDPCGRTFDATPEPSGESPEQASKLPEQGEPQNDPRAEAPVIADGKRWGTQEDLDIAYWIAGLVDAFLEQDAPARRNMATWANDVRLMRKQDRREPRHIRALFQWAHGHHFWSSNILSPGKLREQWTQLAAQRKRERGEAPNATGQPGNGSGGLERQFSDPEYARANW